MYLHGFHAIHERLTSGDGLALLLARGGQRSRDLRAAAAQHGVPVRDVSLEELTRLCGHREHRGALLDVADDGPSASLSGFLSAAAPRSLVVVLDGVTDPMNAGSILRSCNMFGVDLVVIRDRRQVPLTSATVARASAGASALVATAEVGNIRRSLSQLREAGFWIYGTAVTGTPLPQAPFHDRIVLLLGAEGSGLSAPTLRACDVIVTIPTVGKIDSLSVSVAAGICLYEIRRGWAQAEAPKGGR